MLCKCVFNKPLHLFHSLAGPAHDKADDAQQTEVDVSAVRTGLSALPAAAPLAASCLGRHPHGPCS